MGAFHDPNSQAGTGFGSSVLGGLGNEAAPAGLPALGTSLPPRRAPGQAPMSAPMATQPGWAPPGAGMGLGLPSQDTALPPAATSGFGNSSQPAQSRLIPGAPLIPSMPSTTGGMSAPLPAGSLLAREAPPAPVTPPTQAMMPNASFLPPAGGTGPAAGAPMLPQAPSAPASPLPAGRNLAALRPNRSTNVIRLALAAVFMLGFLGLAAYFLKDTISSYLGSTPALPETVDGSTKSAAPIAGPADTDLKGAENKGKTAEATARLPDPNASKETGFLQGAPNPSPMAESAKPLMGVVSNLEDKTVPKDEPTVLKAAEPAGTPLVKTVGPMNGKEQIASVPPNGTDTQPPKIPEAAPGAPTLRNSGAAPLDEKPSDKIPTEAEPALNTLKAFLSATTAKERANHVLGAELMKPLLDRYYSNNNDGPIAVDHISFGRYDKQPELGTGAHCIFHIESKTWEYPVPAMLEEQADGWKVDWLTFIELKDRKLEDFFKTYQEGKAAFHVGIFRQHYFGDEVPNRDQKDAFSIGLPHPNPFRAPVFLTKEAALARELRDRLPWEVHVWAIVELEWKKLGTQQWVELVSMPQMHWYSIPGAPRPISTSEKPPMEDTTGGPQQGEIFPPGIRRSAPGSAPAVLKAKPVPAQTFPPGIKRSPATSGR
jgi:hypothetical protein